MKEPTTWLYQYLKAYIKASVEKYPTDRTKWLGTPGASRMKLWALVLQKRGIMVGNLSALDSEGTPGIEIDLHKTFNDSIWPWEVDRVARQVLEHNPSFDAFPEQRRALEGVKKKPIDLADYIPPKPQPIIQRFQRPGEQETIRMILPK